MDPNSPVTDTILSVLAELLAKVDPETYESDMAARMRIDASIENLKDGIKPYSTYEEGDLVRHRIEQRLEVIDQNVATVHRLLSRLRKGEAD